MLMPAKLRKYAKYPVQVQKCVEDSRMWYFEKSSIFVISPKKFEHQRKAILAFLDMGKAFHKRGGDAGGVGNSNKRKQDKDYNIGRKHEDFNTTLNNTNIERVTEF